jgi:hypothetical protein
MAGLYFQATRSAGIDAGFPLDDSWIHAQYSRTLVEGRPFEYVPGEKSIGTTSVLYDLVWAAATLVSGEYVYTAYALNIIFTIALAVLLVHILLRYRVPPLVAGAGAALIVSSHPFPWSMLSGMETALAAFLTVAAVWAHVTWGWERGWRPLVAPALMALAAMTRPENLVLFPLAEVDRFIMWRWRQPHLPHPVKRFFMRAGAFLLVLAPYIALNFSIHGGPVPNTYEAKVGRLGLRSAVQDEGLHAFGAHLTKAWEVTVSAVQYVYEDNALLLIFVVAGLAVTFIPRWRTDEDRPRSLLALLTFVGGAAATGLVTMGMFFPGQSQRYLIQWIPLILIFGVVGLHAFARLLARLQPAFQRSIYVGAVLVFIAADIVVLAVQYPGQVDHYTTSVKNINRMQVALGQWVNENTPPDAVIATNDIGAIAFFGDREIVDTIGLIDPEVVRRKHRPDATEAMLDYLRQRGVTHALLFPTWHPDLILNRHFYPIKRVVLQDNVICGDDRMLVMKVNWNQPPKDYEAPAWAAQERKQCRIWAELNRF